MAKPALKLVAPTPVNGTVARPPRRRPNAELRPREYLTSAEVDRLIKAAGDNRNGHRDATMILLAFRHGLRAAELVTLRWDNVDLAHGKMHVNRVKSGSPSVHPISCVESRALRRLKRESAESPFVFVSERGVPFTTSGFRRDRRGRRWPCGTPGSSSPTDFLDLESPLCSVPPEPGSTNKMAIAPALARPRSAAL
jgi:integrase